MANKILQKKWAEGKFLVDINGSFGTNTASDPTAASIKGVGFSVKFTSTGLYTITFTNPYVNLISIVATLQTATATDAKIGVGTYTASTRALQIRTTKSSDGTVLNIAADANNRVNFCATFAQSAVVA